MAYRGTRVALENLLWDAYDWSSQIGEDGAWEMQDISSFPDWRLEINEFVEFDIEYESYLGSFVDILDEDNEESLEYAQQPGYSALLLVSGWGIKIRFEVNDLMDDKFIYGKILPLDDILTNFETYLDSHFERQTMYILK